MAVAGVLSCAAGARAQDLQPGEPTPTGQTITPTAAQGALFQALNPDLPGLPDYSAGQAAAVALSPDSRTLLILTSGFNRRFDAVGHLAPEQSDEYVFVYDVSGAAPTKRQVIPVHNTFLGVAWAPSGQQFYVSGGVDDQVIEFQSELSGFQKARVFALGHKAGLGMQVQPSAAGLAISPDGRRLIVANVQNDSVSLIDLVSGVTSELDLRPGVHDPKRAGAVGGTYPRTVVWTSNRKAYVGAARDREVIALNLGPKGLMLGPRIHVRGQPAALLANPKSQRLYAALDNTDGLAVIDSTKGRVLETVPTAAPEGMLADAARLGGAGSNGLAMSLDGRTLLVTNGGANALAVVRLGDRAAGLPPARSARRGDDDAPAKAAGSKVVGLIPTGWYPTAVAVRADGRQLYVVNGKSNTGPNADNCKRSLSSSRGAENACRAANQYVWQLEKAGFLTLPAPSPAELGRLTRQVAQNDHFARAGAAQSEAVAGFLRQHIRHVIYVVKENRTYDQILGDLEVGNGDPKLALFGRGITPNQHALAREFVDLDAFFDSGESSNTGWDWTTAARTNDWTEREAPVNYARRGLQYDQEGPNRNVNVGLAILAERREANPLTPDDPNLLAGARDVAAPDGPGGDPGAGYIWNSALRAGLSVRNWGFFADLARYADGVSSKAAIPLEREPWRTKTTVYFPATPALVAISDPYFRGFDQAFPDYWRFKEWEREFDGFVTAGQAPSLMLVRLPHDHTGSFAQAIDEVNTIETEVADNDYAVGLLMEKVSHSPFARDTLVFVIEDDAQDGPDHVDAHRSIALVAGPYVKRGAVVSTRYTTVDLIRTIEAALGLAPMGLNDALAEPMTDAFDVAGSTDWRFTATVPGVLRSTRLPLPAAPTSPSPQATACVTRPSHDAAYWAAAMTGQDFSQEDRLDTAAFNQAVWRGLRGNEPYPATRSGADLRHDRDRLLAETRADGCGS
jgi:DNA-binding beta-propeller fold protein YncE